jgi:hypothetical protein
MADDYCFSTNQKVDWYVRLTGVVLFLLRLTR